MKMKKFSPRVLFSILLTAAFLTLSAALSRAAEPAEQKMSLSKYPVYFCTLADASPDAPRLADCPETVRRGLEYLKTVDLNALPLGKTLIDGERLFINVQEYETKSTDPPVFESHRKYYDIQLILEGNESIGVARAKENYPISKPYDPEADYQLYTPTERPVWLADGTTPCLLNLGPGDLAIFGPNDLHAPSLNPGASPSSKAVHVKKAVVKCRIEK